MEINDFRIALMSFAPSRNILIERGYSESFADRIINKKFRLEKNETIKPFSKSNLIDDFLLNYNLTDFSIHRISFPNAIEFLEESKIVAYIDGGYLITKENESLIYLIFSDDIENEEIFCNSGEDFFDLLLIIAEFSSKVLNGEINPADQKVISGYLKRCNEINPLFDFELMF